MELAIQLVVWVCLGATCAMIAHTRGRNPVGWFFIGMLTSCVGVILVLVLPDLKKQQAEFERLRAQNRMLKERLDKDRMVADQRQDEAERRLRAHDRVLGVDTDSAPQVEGAAAGSALPPSGPPDAPNDAPGGPASRQWYYALDSRERGPVPVGELRPLWQAGRVGPDTLVWAEGMAQWTPIRSVPGLGEVLRG